MSSRISVVITDLDNTLFDWVGIWYASFDALITRLSQDSGVDREQLLTEAKRVHETHGTSEYAFLIDELPSLRKKHPEGQLSAIYADAITAHREARRAHLRLYPTVEETLKKLKRDGVLIVGYTESMAFYTNYRMRKLGLDGLLDYLYSPPDHDLPRGLTPEQIRKYPASSYELNATVHRFLPRSELKPNPKVLLDIVRGVGAIPAQCLYVGDSLMKDIAMANAAHVTSAIANYGAAQHKESYELLRKVTHWTAETVEREKTVIASGSVKATETLDVCFGQILSKFDFTRFAPPSNDADISHVIEIWKKTVEVQQHFNEIEMQIRNVAITVLAALFGAAGFALQTEYYVAMAAFEFQIATLILFAALVAVLAFYFMDEIWYHRLLVGAVNHGIKIENGLSARIPEISLGAAIGAASPISFIGFKLRSKHKMRVFYGLMGLVVAAFLCGSFFMEAHKSDETTSVPLASDTTKRSSDGQQDIQPRALPNQGQTPPSPPTADPANSDETPSDGQQ